MDKRISQLSGHYIVCGIEGVGLHIASELSMTDRRFVVIDTDEKAGGNALEGLGETLYLQGDATDGITLQKAGLDRAAGLFAVSGDDNRNLVISLTAKQLNTRIRVVAQCINLKNTDKLKKAGADAVVSPSHIGGLRMASEMIRPTVVSFLDIMLRDKEKKLRVEELLVPAAFVGKPLSALALERCPGILLLALAVSDGWVYNPSRSHTIASGSRLIFIATPEDQSELQSLLSGRA